MANLQYAKAKGREAENAVVEFLRARGYRGAERRRLSGDADKGDIAGIVDFAIEVKNEKRISLADYVFQARREAANAGAKFGVAWVKRRGKADPGDWYVVMDGHTFVRLMREWHDSHTPF